MWADGPMVAFDLESTGVDPEEARIVTATLAWINGTDVRVRNWLVDPGIEISEEASAIHGITTEMARLSGLAPAIACGQIFADLDEAWSLKTPVVIYNASYDLTVLDRELRRHSGTSLGVTGPVIDPFVIDKAVDKYRRGSRTLSAVCEHYRVTLTGAHTSEGDCLAAARAAWRLAQNYPEQVGLVSLDELHAKQQAWRAEWAVGFQDYLRKQGKDEHVDGAWPLRAVA